MAETLEVEGINCYDSASQPGLLATKSDGTKASGRHRAAGPAVDRDGTSSSSENGVGKMQVTRRSLVGCPCRAASANNHGALFRA